MTIDQHRARQRRMVQCAQAIAFVVSVAAIGFVVCCNRSARPAPTKIPPPPTSAALSVRLVVVTDAAGRSPWDDWLAAETIRLRDDFARVNIALDVAVERVRKPEWFAADAATLKAIPAGDLLTLYLVNTITGNGRPVAGFAWTRAAFVAFPACPHAPAHELAHLLGLTHVDDGSNIMAPATCGRSFHEFQGIAMRDSIALKGQSCTEWVCK